MPLALFALVTLLSMVNATRPPPRAQLRVHHPLHDRPRRCGSRGRSSAEDWVQVAIKTYIVVATISGALGPLALYLPLPGSDTFLYFGTRAEGLFKDPNVYAAFLVPAAIILLEELTTPRLLRLAPEPCDRGVRPRARSASSSPTRAPPGSTTRSRSPSSSLVQASRQGGLRRAVKSIVLLGVERRRRPRRARGDRLARVPAAALAPRRPTTTQRFANQTSAIDDMTRHIFGYGPGQSEVLLPLSTHSSFIRAAFEQGLLGLAYAGARPPRDADLRPASSPVRAARRERRRHCGAARHLARADRRTASSSTRCTGVISGSSRAHLVRLRDARRHAVQTRAARLDRLAPTAQRSQGSRATWPIGTLMSMLNRAAHESRRASARTPASPPPALRSTHRRPSGRPPLRAQVSLRQAVGRIALLWTVCLRDLQAVGRRHRRGRSGRRRSSPSIWLVVHPLGRHSCTAP